MKSLPPGTTSPEPPAATSPTLEPNRIRESSDAPAHRYQVTVPALFHDGALKISGVVCNLSESGALVQGARSEPPHVLASAAES